MRKKKFVYLILILLSLNLQAQVPGEQRGLYVNRFVSLIASGANEDDIDASTSILTNSFAETQLLQYCMENHITYISLYGLRNIFYGSPPLAQVCNLCLLNN